MNAPMNQLKAHAAKIRTASIYPGHIPVAVKTDSDVTQNLFQMTA